MARNSPILLGTYLGREVWSVDINRFVDLRGFDLHGMLLLVHTGLNPVSHNETSELVSEIVDRRPLAVFVIGPEAESVFDHLLQALDTPTLPLPVMTNFSTATISEAVDDFISATWPAESCWDMWQGYFLVSIRGPISEMVVAARRHVEP